jgi:predicted transcriptional regulator
MKWTVRKKKDKWGVFLVKKYCATDEDVCYGVSINKETAQFMAKRLNNPVYVESDKELE